MTSEVKKGIFPSKKHSISIDKKNLLILKNYYKSKKIIEISKKMAIS